MQNNFKPRGIVKWQAFAAVYDPFDFSSRVNQNVLFQENVELSENQIEQLNLDLLAASQNSLTVDIVFYQEGRFQTVTGIVNSIDPVSQTFKVDSLQLKMSELLEIIYDNELY